MPLSPGGKAMQEIVRYLTARTMTRDGRIAIAALAFCIVGLASVGWFHAYPPNPSPTETSDARVAPGGIATEPTEDGPGVPVTAPVTDAAFPEWPETKMEGLAAKKLLLKTMKAVARSFQRVKAYTMIFRKQERIDDKLLPEQTYFVKVRNRPFAIYMKGIAPVKGRELIYAKGQFDDQVMCHPVGFSRLLMPRLKVPADHPLIMAESRHSLDEAGLANLIQKLARFQQRDLEEPEEITILDRVESPDGKKWLRSTHIHPVRREGRPFCESRILYDPVSRLPLRFTGYDWPAPGSSKRLMGERYLYDDLDLDAALTARDFDPANPEYAFERF
jgi:hypothetical protein